MMPENTVLYAALPNLSETIAESRRIMQERIQQNPALHEWFDKRQSGPGMDQAIGTMREFGAQLGDEIAAGAGMDEKGNPVGPIVLAELKNPAGFRAFFDEEVKKLGAEGKNAPAIRFVDDPNAGAGSEQATAECDSILLMLGIERLPRLEFFPLAMPPAVASSG